MRREPLIAIVILVIVLVAALAYLGRGGEREGWSENWHPYLRAWWVPPENRENFKAEAIRLGLLELYDDGGRWIIPNENIEELKKILKELIENFGGWWENDDTIYYHDPVMTFSSASGPAADESAARDWMTQRVIWTVPPENVEEFRKEERARGFIVKYPDGTVELCIRGRENEFKELVENFGGEWTGDVRPLPEGGLVEIRSRVENLMGFSGGDELDDAEPSLVPTSELQVVEAVAADEYEKAWAGMNTTDYNYRGHTCRVNIPARVDMKSWEYHFNVYNNHLVQSLDPYNYKDIEAGVGWTYSGEMVPGLYIYCAVDGLAVVWKEIPEGTSRDITLFVETYGANRGYMYVYDPYSGRSLSYLITVTALNSLAVVQQEAMTMDPPNWIDTSHHPAKIYQNMLKNSSDSWVWWKSPIPTGYFADLPLMEEHGYEDPSYSIYTWSQFEHDFTFHSLYDIELGLYLYLSQGTKLWLEFYDYQGYEKEWFTVWEGATPTWVNQVGWYEPSYAIQVVYLMTDVGVGGTLLQEFVVTRDILWKRLTEIMARWPFAGSAERSALWKELGGICLQWPYAPVSSSGVTGTSELEQNGEKSSEVAAGAISHPGGTILEVAQGQPFLLRYRLNWGEVDVPGFYSIVLHWLNYENKPSENLTFLRAEAYFDNGEAIDNTVTLKATPSGADTAYILTVSNSAGDLRDGIFNVDIWLQAAGEGEVPHEVTDNHPIWHSMGNFSIAESTIVDVAAGPVTVRIPHGSTQIYPDADVYAQGNGQGEFWQSQLKFDINGVPSGVTVDSVKLWLYRFDGWGAGESMYVYKVNDQEWDEAITAGEFDDQTLTNQETRAIGWDSNGWDYVDVVNQFLADYNAGNAYTTIRLRHVDDDSSASNYIYNTAELILGSDPGQFWRTFYSRDHSDYRPYLEVKYTLPA